MNCSKRLSSTIQVLFFLLMCTMSISLVSCSSDDDTDPDSDAPIRLTVVDFGLVEFFYEGLSSITPNETAYQISAASEFGLEENWVIFLNMPKAVGNYEIGVEPILQMSIIDADPCDPPNSCGPLPYDYQAYEGTLVLEIAEEGQRLKGAFNFKARDPDTDLELEVTGGEFDIINN